MLAVPLVPVALSDAVYVPSPLSVTLERLPREVASTTAPHELVRALPLASFAWTVIVAVAGREEPSALIDGVLAVIVESAALTAPGVMSNVALSALVSAPELAVS